MLYMDYRVLLKLAANRIDAANRAKDEVSWLDWQGGNFTVKSAYELGCGTKEKIVWVGGYGNVCGG